MPLTTCPGQDELLALRLGKLPMELALEIGEHLDQCPDCRANVETIRDSHDTLLLSLRRPPGEGLFAQEAELQGAMQAVRAIGTQFQWQAVPAEGQTKGDRESLRTLRDYQLLEELGAGGMGTVYKARHQRLKRIVALKLLPLDRTRDKRAVARFEREMEAVGKLEHANVVRALDAGEHENMHYLVMEFVDGLDLSHVVKRHGPLAVADACELVRQAAAGLQCAYEHGLVHRDVKPSNLMLTAAGQVKVLDLGLALLLAEQPGGEELTGASQVMGTADYCAPEQAGDSHTVDVRADIYSLGCTLYKLLTGHAPFSGEQFDTTIKKLMAHTTQPVRPVGELRPDVPDGLANVLDRMLAKSPAARYSSPIEVVTAIAPFAAGSDLKELYAEVSRAAEPSVAAPTSETPSHLSSALTGTRPGAGPQPAAGFANRATETYVRNRPPRRGLKIAAAAAAFVLLAGVIIVIKNRQGEVVAWFQTDSRADVSLAPGYTAEVKPSDEPTGRLTPGTRERVARHDLLGRPTAPQDGVWPADAPLPAIAPFDQEQARKHQQAWADYLNLPLEYTNTIGMKFVLIPPGEFMMGSTPEEIEETLKQVDPNDKTWQECIKSEAPQHKVVLTRPFYLAVHEVTQKEYEAVMGNNPSSFSKSGPDEKLREQLADLDADNLPVENVSWNDAAEFCAKLSKQEEMNPFYSRAGETITPLKGNAYRLPTEAEWEFACRAGTTTKFWAGDNEQDLSSAGWFGNHPGGRTHKVEELPRNSFGLFDVHGNVWEWVEDVREPAFYERFGDTPAIDPKCVLSAGSQRVLRGGSWGNDASRCRSAGRGYANPQDSSFYIGFRVAVAAVVKPTADSNTKRQRGELGDAAAVADPTGRLTPGTRERVARQDLARPTVPQNDAWPEEAPVPAIAPFDEDQARKHQQDWADYLKLPLEYTNSIGMKFVLIPPGEFTMGGTAAEIEQPLKDAGDDKDWQEHIRSEAPQHKVVLTRPIYLGVHEVTQNEYQAIMGENPSSFAKTGPDAELVANVADLDTENHPVEGVTWNDAAEFCAKLSRQEDLKPFYFRAGETVSPLKGNGYRLPSEAEWEFACRAGTTTRFWNGDVAPTGWYGANSGGRTHEVGELPRNPFGLFDVHGNVWEWVEDGWQASAYDQFSDKPAMNPSSPFSAGSQRVVRGGDWWDDTASSCRSSRRHAVDPAERYDRLGFRVVLMAVVSPAGR